MGRRGQARFRARIAPAAARPLQEVLP